VATTPKAHSGLYKISDLARETGVAPGTIKFYMRRGLLPPPTVKTGRNMAYYDRGFVDRIRCIKELQTKRDLRLDVIKAILERNSDVISPQEVRTLLGLEGRFYEQVHFAPDMEPVARASVLERYATPAETVDYCVREGILTPVTRAGVEYFEGDDVLLLENFAEMRAAGLGPEILPHRTTLPMYVDAIDRLARAELKAFTRAVTGKVDEVRLAEMALAGVKLVERFLVLLRRKFLLRAIQELREQSVNRSARTGN
jgi:DNA-binding transcriptional MerR regulator